MELNCKDSKFFLDCTHIHDWPEANNTYDFYKNNIYLSNLSKSIRFIIMKTTCLYTFLSVGPHLE